jgi:hypothetical protein
MHTLLQITQVLRIHMRFPARVWFKHFKGSCGFHVLKLTVESFWSTQFEPSTSSVKHARCQKALLFGLGPTPTQWALTFCSPMENPICHFITSSSTVYLVVLLNAFLLPECNCSVWVCPLWHCSIPEPVNVDPLWLLLLCSAGMAWWVNRLWVIADFCHNPPLPLVCPDGISHICLPVL